MRASMRTSGREKSLHSKGARLYAGLLTGWLLLLITALGILYQNNLALARLRFEQYVGDLRQGVQDRLQLNESAIEGFAALLAAMPEFDRSQAEHYARQLMAHYPHLYMLEVVQRIERTEIAEFTGRMRREFTDFRIRAFDYGRSRHWVDPESKPFYYPIVFQSPLLTGDARVLGLDVHSQPLLREALERSGRLGRPVATRPFKLIEGDPAFVLHRPVLRPGEPSAEPFGLQRYALLVVRARSLLPAPSEVPAGVEVTLCYRDCGGGNDANLLISVSNSPASGLEARLLPSIESTHVHPLAEQPFVLKVRRQLGWSDIDLAGAAATLALALVALPLVLTFARAFHRDRMELAREQERLYRLANRDSLTGLANRFCVRDRLGQAIARAERDGTEVGILYIDLDGFKQVNDRLGHAQGDELLQRVAERLAQALRHGDTLARHGGDEFLFLIGAQASRAAVQQVATRIRDLLREPFELAAASLQVGVSIGCALYPGDATAADELIDLADRDMYRQKAGR